MSGVKSKVLIYSLNYGQSFDINGILEEWDKGNVINRYRILELWKKIINPQWFEQNTTGNNLNQPITMTSDKSGETELSDFTHCIICSAVIIESSFR